MGDHSLRSLEVLRFRKRPVEVEAYQLTKEIILEALVSQKSPPGLTLGGASWHAGRGEIHWARYSCTTIHGQETEVVEGDWVITEPDGIHHYPCKPDVFEATYDLASKAEGRPSSTSKGEA